MAASPGHLHKLMAKNYKIMKTAWKKTTQLVQSRISLSIRTAQGELQFIPIRSGARQPLHPLAFLRQNRSRWYTTHAVSNARTAARSGTSGVKYDRASFPRSSTGSAVNALTGRAPFASTLRPNLTGGALSRTAGGYSLGSGRIGGARFFSHTPASPAQVVQNVSQAVRAFYLSGQKAQFNGVDPTTGNKRFRAVSSLQEQTSRKINSMPKATPGSYVDFKVNPTITAISPLNLIAGYPSDGSFEHQQTTLNTDGLLNILSVDFSRALKDLAAVLNDLKKLSDLGNLPITYESPDTIRIHFPGCDAETVEGLCDEIGVTRGIVSQDSNFDTFAGTEIALLFPFAPSKPASIVDFQQLERFGFSVDPPSPVNWKTMISSSGSEDDEFSIRSDTGLEIVDADEVAAETYSLISKCFSPEGYGSLSSPSKSSEFKDASSPLEYQDFEGLYRFIELCDDARRQ